MNFYADGQGKSILKLLDSHFQIHSNYPSELYELLNTSLRDALNISLTQQGKDLIKNLNLLEDCLRTKAKEYSNKEVYRVTRGVKLDLKVNDFLNSIADQLRNHSNHIESALGNLSNLLVNSTIKSTANHVREFLDGNNTNKVDSEIYQELVKEFNLESRNSLGDRLTALCGFTDLNRYASELSNLATTLFKLSNDFRFLSSGPRSGIGEMTLPENEPGSSIMPGKVNPTQCESLSMVGGQVLGSVNSILIATSSNIFEGNHFLPLIANNSVRATKLLSDGLRSFTLKCCEGAAFNDPSLSVDYNLFKENKHI